MATLGAAVIGILFTLAMRCAEKNMFDLFQSIIGFIAPPMAAVFLAGVLWKRATGAAAIWTLAAGSAVSLSVGACQIWSWPHQQFWPHYLMLSFYLFLGMFAAMIVLSLATRKSSEEEELPTLKETYAAQQASPRLIWYLWGCLALAMLVVYVVFQRMSISV